MGGMSGGRRRDTKEPGRQQACYLSQSEGEDLASRPCRTRGCPTHEGTQGLRSLWAKRTELLREGVGATRAHHGHGEREAWNPPPTGQQNSSARCQSAGAGTRVGGPRRGTTLPWLPGPSGGTASHHWQAYLVVSASEKSQGGRVPPGRTLRVESPGDKERGGTA